MQTFVSYVCSLAVSKAFRFSKRPRNFVIAMAVFGNSNSLPISLVLSLSQTIKGLHWEKVLEDNDQKVAARGILYLLIFQQLGQLVRWSWGFNVLLAPSDEQDDVDDSERGCATEERRPLLAEFPGFEEQPCEQATRSAGESRDAREEAVQDSDKMVTSAENASHFAKQSLALQKRPLSSASLEEMPSTIAGKSNKASSAPLAPPNGHVKPTNNVRTPPLVNGSLDPVIEEPLSKTLKRNIRWYLVVSKDWIALMYSKTLEVFGLIFTKLPHSFQLQLKAVLKGFQRSTQMILSFMNPPLWAMLAAVIVASIPRLQNFFFSDGTFFKSSVTSAIEQSSGVAVPLILVVLGGNLARNTLPTTNKSAMDRKEESQLLVASLISRMLLPFLIMAPLLAVTAKFIPVSILDDPIFVIVCFLITGAPTALQLAQICQINNVYMGTMSRLLFHSYVVWILPSTLILVMCALEVVEWAQG